MELVIIWIAIALGVGAWANAWGRNFIGWAALGFLIGFFAAIALLIAGKTKQKKAEEAVEVEALTNRLRRD